MFNKNKEKLVKADVSLAQDTFELLKNCVADENHAWGNFIATWDEKYLDEFDKTRQMRTVALDMAFREIRGSPPDAEQWCQGKHKAAKAMGWQEDAARYLSVGRKDLAKKAAEQYKKLYLEYLQLMGINEKNAKIGNSKA